MAKTLNRILSIVLVAAMLMSFFVGIGGTVKAEGTTFPDTTGHWASSSITRWTDEGIVHGYPDGTFKPDAQITRAEFSVIMQNLLKLTEKAENPFPDVRDSSWMATPILCLVKDGIIKGYSDGTFGPNNPILRQEAFVMLGRAFYFPEAENPTLSNFSDGSSVSSYAKGYIQTIVDIGAIAGYPDGTIRPKEPITRAEIMSVLDRLISLYVKEDGTVADADKSFVLVVANDAILTAPTDSFVIARRAWENLHVNCLAVDDEQLYLVPEERHVPVTDPEVPATCTEPGKTEGSHCSFCGEVLVEQQELPVLGHLWGNVTFEWAEDYSSATASRVCQRDSSHVDVNEDVQIVKTVVKEANCKDVGVISYTATAVFDSDQYTDVKVVTTEALGHDWGEWTVTTEPTCTVAGVKTRTCSRCGETETEEIPALGHTEGEPKEEDRVEPTCTATGSYDTVIYCSVCGAEISRVHNTIPALGHDWGEWTVLAPATCTADCVESRTCSRCGMSEVRALSATGHTAGEAAKENEVPATCTEAGSYDMVVRCSVCDAILSSEHFTTEALGHDWGEWTAITPATCTTAGAEKRTCARCNETETRVVPATGHTPGEAARENEVPATCTEAGSYDMVVRCTVCNAIISSEHFTTEALGHDWGEWGVTTAPTCVTAGVETRTCSRCGETETRSIDATGVHTPGDTFIVNMTPATCTEDGSYDEVVYCAVCNQELSRNHVTVAKLGHNWSEWTITPATCTEEGVKTRTCARCDATETEVISAEGHKPGTAVKENEVAPTCTTVGGYDKVVRCKVCDAIISTEHTEVAALGHLWSDWTVKTPATCTEAGEETRTCYRCGETETRTIEALGHTPAEAVKENEVAATCTTAGGYDMVVYCSVCGTELSREHTTIEALGHTPAEAVKENEVAATCTEAGGYDMVVYCSVCGEELSREHTELEALGHDWGEWTTIVEATCTAKGAEKRTCSRCNETETRVVPAKGHTEGEPTVENRVEPTCTEAGGYDTVVYCSVCGAELSREHTEIPALGHDWSEWMVTTPATCTEKGVETRTCSRCDASETREIEALGHTPAEAVKENETAATCTEAGGYDMVIYCSVCNEELSRVHTDLPALGHEWGEWAETTPATCTGKGVETRTCSRCGETETRAIDALGHTPADAVKENDVAATCTEAGGYDLVIYCSVCGEELYRVHVDVPAAGHKEGEQELYVLEDGMLSLQTHCTVCDELLTKQDFSEKFYLSATDANEITVAGTAFDNYYATLVFPKDAVVSASVLDILARMTNVSSLGVSGTRTHTIHIETGMENTASLETWLENVCNFKSAKIQGHIDGKPYSYELTGTPKTENENYHAILGTTETEQTRAAWQALTAAMTSTTQAADDSYILIKNGAYLQIGTEKLQFETKDDLLLNNFNDIAALNQNIRDNLTLVEAQAAETQVEIILPAGTTLAVGQSVVTLDYDTKITVDGLEMSEALSTALSTLRDTTTLKGMVVSLVGLLNEAVGAADGRDVTVNVEFLHRHIPGEAVKENEVAATCVEDGGYDLVVYCTECGEEISREHVVIPATGEHTEGDTVIENMTVPTCTSLGSYDEVVYCKVCGTELRRETVTVGKLAHTPGDPVKENEEEATCTEAGGYDMVVYCTVCNTEIGREHTEIPALGHEWGEWVITDSTCTEAGNKTHTCSRCGETETVVIDAAGHKPGEAAKENEVAATCTTAGGYDMVVRCTVCNAIISSEHTEIPALGHDWGEWTVTTAATCTEDGAETRTCSRCGETETRPIIATGHIAGEIVNENVVEPTCTEPGSYDLVVRCTVCNEILSIRHEVTPALGHKEGEAELYVLEDGTLSLRTYCTVCNELLAHEEYNEKFYVSASDVNTTTVAGTAFDNYYATLVFPKDAEVSAAVLDILARMTNVSSLGVNGTREHTIHIETGMDNTANLETWLENVCNFSGATVHGTIAGKPYSYELTGTPKTENDNYHAILGTTETEQTRAAWQALTAAMTSTTQAADDSYVLIMNGAYLQIGTEKLQFETENDLLLNNFNDIAALNAAIRTNLTLVEAQPAETQVEIILPAGTTLAVGQSVVTLDYDTKITVDGLVMTEALNTALSTLRDVTTPKALIMNLVGLLNEAVGAADGQDVTVNVEFLHRHIPGEAVKENEVAPTCVDKGSYDLVVYCTVCGEEISRETVEVEATGEHTEGEAELYVLEDGKLSLRTYCTVCEELLAHEEYNEKFYVSATDANKITVAGTAFDNYYATLVFPKNAVVSASVLDILARMTNVTSLGVTGTREHTIHIETGMDNTANLETWLENVCNFNHARIQGHIDGKPYSYELTGTPKTENDNYHAILGTTETEQTRTAWQALTAAMTSTTQAADDSYVLIKNGAYLQIGTEKLQFETENDLLLNNFNDITALNTAIRTNLTLVEAQAAKTQVEIILPAGTTLAVGQSVVTLKYDTKITVDGLAMTDALNTALSTLRDTTTPKGMVMNLVGLLNEVVGAADGKNVIVNVTFIDPEHEHTPGQAVSENYTAATCTKDGGYDLVVYCTECGDELYRIHVEIPALGHILDKTSAVEPTCTENGNIEYWTCRRCGKHYSDADAANEVENVVVNALGHVPVEKTLVASDGALTVSNVCSRCNTVLDENPSTEKFYLSVAGGNGLKVAATAFDNYYATLVFPKPAVVAASSATIYARMTNVLSLGVSGTREHSITIQTDWDNQVPLDGENGWLNHVSEFGSATVTGTINNNPFKYNLTGAPEKVDDTYYAILGTTDTEQTRTAWHALTEQISSTTQSTDDSYILVKYGSYLQIGTQRLYFEKFRDLKLDNFNNMADLNQMIRETVALNTNAAPLADGEQVEIFLAAGTQLAVGSSIATLDKDALIKISGLNLEADDPLLICLETLRDCTTTKAIVSNLVSLVNRVVGAADGQTVNVEISFSEPQASLIYINDQGFIMHVLDNGSMVKDEATEKFYMSVKDKNSVGLTGTVFSNYDATLVYPKNAELLASEVTIFARMTNVSGLGVNGTREHQVTFETGLESTPNLDTWMKNLAEFSTATINGNVSGKAFTYVLTNKTLEADAHHALYADTDETQASAAWQALTANVTSTTGGNDSAVRLANGSYLQFGNEKLQFKADVTDDLAITDFSDLTAVMTTVSQTLKVVTDVPNADTQVVICLKAGTMLAVGSSRVTLNKDCMITMDGIDMTDLGTALSTIWNSESLVAMVVNAVSLLNTAVSAINNRTVTLNVSFQ